MLAKYISANAKLFRNAVHGSDSYEAAGREIELLFPTITGSVELKCHVSHFWFLHRRRRWNQLWKRAPGGSQRGWRRTKDLPGKVKANSVLLLFGFNIMTRWRESIVEVFWFLQFQCISPLADMWCQPFSRASL